MTQKHATERRRVFKKHQQHRDPHQLQRKVK